MDSRNSTPLDSTVYSEQVQRLKALLLKDDERKRKKDILDLSEVSSYNSSHIPDEKDLAPIIEGQSYVEKQLQEQVQYYRHALRELKQKSEIIASENEKLYERVRQDALNTAVDENSDSEKVVDSKLVTTNDALEDDENEEDCEHTPRPRERLLRTKSERKHDVEDKSQSQTVGHNQDSQKCTSIKRTSSTGAHESMVNCHFSLENEINKIRSLYENKTKHLESLLKGARTELQENQNEIKKLKSELNMFHVAEKEQEDNLTQPSGAVVPHNLAPIVSKGEIRVINRLTKEKDALIESVAKQKETLEESKRKQIEAFLQVKKSCELVEESQLEKQEAVIQAKQLREELTRRKTFHDNLMKEHQSKYAKEEEKRKSEFDSLLRQLNSKNDDLSANLGASKIQLERETKEKISLKTELEQLKSHLSVQRTEADTLINESRKELMDGLKCKVLAEQELDHVNGQYRLKDKQKQQEIERLNIELKETKRRLDASENQLQKQMEDCVNLTDEMNSMKRKLNSEQVNIASMSSSHKGEIERLKYEHAQQVQQYTLCIHDAENRYSSTKSELTQLLDTQIGISNKFKVECKHLSDDLAMERQKFSDKTNRLADHCDALEKHLTDIIAQQKFAEAEKEKRVSQITELSKELETSKSYKDQVLVLMNKQSALLRDRQLLCQEIEFLRTQLQPNNVSHS